MSIEGLVEYAKALSADTSISGIIAMAILVLMGIAIVGGALFGLKNGTVKQFLNCVIAIVSVFLSVIVLGMKNELVSKFYDGKSLKDALLALEEYNISIVMQEDVAKLLDCFESGIITDVIMVPIASLVLPLLFVVLFLAIYFVLKIIAFIILFITGIGRGRKGILSRLLGAVIGAVKGAAIAAIILFPIAALLSFADSSVEILREEPEDNEAATAVVELYDAYLSKASESPIIDMINALGGEKLYTYLATTEIDGEQADTRDTLDHLVRIWTYTYGLQEMDWKSLSADNKKAIDDIILQISEDEFLSRSASGIFRGIAKATSDGVITINLGDPYDEIVVSALDIFSGSTKDNLSEDLDTFKEVYFILSDSNVLIALNQSTDAAMEAFTAKDAYGKTVIARIIETLRENTRTEALVETMAKLSISLMAGDLGLDQDAIEAYEGIKNDLNGVLSANGGNYESEEERTAAVNTALKDALVENNVTLSDEVVDEMTDYVINNVEEDAELTDEVVFDIIFSYYDAYTNAQTN